MRSRGTNGVTNGIALDRRSRAADSAIVASSNQGRVPLRVIFGVTTALGFFSALRGVLLRLDLHRKAGVVRPAARAQSRLLVLVGVLTPGDPVAVAPVPVRSRDVEGGRPRALAGVFVATLVHVATGRGVAHGDLLGRSASRCDSWLVEAQRMFFLNFDWEMMTYWTIVGLSHALRYHREARARELSAASSRPGWSRHSCRRCSGSCSRTSSSTP